jgi:2-polyprenyl-3-methyl-5-hydroxy-6-metoxy-1,4-benzoquinol methylase
VTKWPEYYEEHRSDLVAELEPPLGQVLDVGCGAGAVGRELRAAGAERLVGVELDPAAAERARPAYDELLVGTVEELLDRIPGSFDTIVCYDVLEHLVDPWRVLSGLRRLANPGCRLHVSVPNARHPAFGLGVLVRGTFGYEEAGLRDVTHLRWFTRKDIAAAVTNAGWHVVREGHNPISRGRKLVTRLTAGRATEFIVGQLTVLARAQGPPAAEEPGRA